MNRQDFGKLVAALRKEHIDEEGKIWTQARLAQKTNLTLEVIGNIERGDKVYLASDVLLPLAKALELTSGERKEFFVAASGVDDEYISRDDPPEIVLEDMLRVLENTQLPAAIMDSFGEIVAMNPGALRLYSLDMSAFEGKNINQATKFNCMRMCFSDEFEAQRKMVGEAWPRFAHGTMSIFRTLSLRYRAHPYFCYILPELKKFRLFRSYWETAPYQEYKNFVDGVIFSTNYPGLGFLQSITSAVRAITPYGELILYSFVPLNLATADVFHELGKQSDVKVYRFASWPDKSIPNK